MCEGVWPARAELKVAKDFECKFNFESQHGAWNGI